MKRIVVLILLGTTMTVAISASLHALNVKAGLWQMSVTTLWKGLPPQFESAMASGRAVTYQTCVKPEDLSTNPWAGGSGQKCTWSVLKSTATDMELRGTSCDMGSEYGMTSEVYGKIHVTDPENGTGSFDITMTGNGHTVSGHSTYTGKRVGSSCPAE